MAVNNSVEIEDVLRRRYLLRQSQQSLIWAAINAFFAFILVIDLKYSIIGSILESNFFQNLVFIFDLLIIFILSLNTIYDLGLYVWEKHIMTPIELTPIQMQLFGVNANEIGFKEYITMKSEENIKTSMPATPPFELSLMSDLDKHSSLNSTALSNGNISAMNDVLSSPNSSLNTTSTSWVFERPNSFLPITPSLSTDEPLNTSTSGLLRLRKSNTKLNNSEPSVTNEKDLNKYLKDFEDREERYEELFQAEKRQERNNSNTAWNFSPTQLSPVLDDSNNKISYQFAIDSPTRLNSVEFDGINTSPSSQSSKATDAMLNKLRIDEMKMNQWIENIRKWISLTILSRLVEQIDKINEILKKMGSFDSLIGEAGLPAIKQTASLKKSQISSLENVLPFIEMSANQQYLIKRIRELSKGGSIGAFKWNSGEAHNFKPWNEELLTDSAIVMHCFCTYMDSRLPSNPNSTEGKSFTNQYFKSISGEVPKSPLYVSQVKVSPPHYKIFTEEDGIWELPIGRNNLFHAILVFLYCVKNKYFGRLGRINLGSSGVNILWVIED